MKKHPLATGLGYDWGQDRQGPPQAGFHKAQLAFAYFRVWFPLWSFYGKSS